MEIQVDAAVHESGASSKKSKLHQNIKGLKINRNKNKGVCM